MAPTNGPRMIPGRLKKRPMMPPITAPVMPRQVAPNFFAPNMLARKSNTSETTMSPIRTPRTRLLMLAVPK